MPEPSAFRLRTAIDQVTDAQELIHTPFEHEVVEQS